jgi:acyl-CoA thioesterase
MEFDSMDQIRAYFTNDEFATKCVGATIDEWEPGRAVCSFIIDDRHHNAQGFVMGGAIFSLADFALAVCSNVGNPPGCSVNHSIDYLNRARGERLIATALVEKQGRTLGFYRVDVHDELGTHVARMNVTTMYAS